MVTIYQRLRELVSGPAPTPKPKIAVSGGTRPDYFRKSSRDKATLARNQAIYDAGGLVTEALKCRARTVLSNGWRLEGDDGAVKAVETAFAGFDFETAVSVLITQADTLGNGIAEIVRTANGGFHSVQIRDAARFVIDTDEYGTIAGYRYLPADAPDDSGGTRLEPTDVIDLVLDPIPGSPYGRALVSTAYDDIIRDTQTAEGTAAAIRRHGFPKVHVRVGQAGEVIAKEDLQSIEKEFRDLNSKNDFVTPYDVELKAIDAAGVPNADTFNSISVSRLCAALGVPEEVLGLGRGSTEATANVRLQTYYDQIAALQRRVARTIGIQLIDRITGTPGAVALVFEDCNPTDDLTTIQWTAQAVAALQACGQRPSVEWIAEQIGIDPSMLEEYTPPAPANPFGQQPPPADDEETPPDETERENAAPDPETVVEEADADLATIARETEQKILAALGLA